MPSMYRRLAALAVVPLKLCSMQTGLANIIWLRLCCTGRLLHKFVCTVSRRTHVKHGSACTLEATGHAVYSRRICTLITQQPVVHAETELVDSRQALHEAQQRILVISQQYNSACAQLDQHTQVHTSFSCRKLPHDRVCLWVLTVLDQTSRLQP